MLPIERPGKIICVGLNYRDHAEEQGTALPEAPLLFAKWQNTLIGPGEPIVIPPIVTKCDYEAELGVVIGARVRDVSAENALEAVAGYICVNDVSARDLQFADGQWTRGKSPDTFCPVGPRLVPRDDVPDPQNLAIRADPERRDDAGVDDGEHGLRRGRPDRLHHAHDHARAGRPDRDRHTRPAWAPSATRRSSCSRATRSRSRSRGLAR